jgi:hypothetical protein
MDMVGCGWTFRQGYAAIRSNFVNRRLKPPKIKKKTNIRLKESPFREAFF